MTMEGTLQKGKKDFWATQTFTLLMQIHQLHHRRITKGLRCCCHQPLLLELPPKVLGLPEGVLMVLS